MWNLLSGLLVNFNLYLCFINISYTEIGSNTASFLKLATAVITFIGSSAMTGHTLKI
jgi:hypothetical protein